jgi:hypothetical protein
VTTLGQGDSGDRFPEFLPDGQRFLYLHTADKDAGLYGGALSGGRFVRILPEITNAMYVPGFLIFRRDNTLMAQPFDPDRLQTTGGVVPIAEQVSIGGNVGYGAFAASRDGTLAYKSGTAGNNRQLAWLSIGRVNDSASSPGRTSSPLLRCRRTTRSWRSASAIPPPAWPTSGWKISRAACVF